MSESDSPPPSASRERDEDREAAIIGAAAGEASEVPEDDSSRSEEEFFERAASESAVEDPALDRLRAQRLKERVENIRSDRKFREDYAPKIFVLICCWLVLILLVIVADGLSLGIEPDAGVYVSPPIGLYAEGFSPSFEVSDNVILALIGGTTASVIGLLVIVIRYIFPQRGRASSQRGQGGPSGKPGFP